MNSHYLSVARRAQHRCEYCHAPEVAFNFPFEVDHIVPAVRGGSDDPSNLALGCRSCNLYKSDAIAATDPLTREEIRLFMPRQDQWPMHFSVTDDSTIRGLTGIGRTTVERLRINSEKQLAARRQWRALKLFP